MEDESEKVRKFNVRLQRTERRHYILEVEAKNEDEARAKAMDQAGDIDFHSGSCSVPEYEVEEVEEDAEDCPGQALPKAD